MNVINLETDKECRAPLVIRIRELRQERSLTQEELAAAIGLSRQSIIALEQGRCLPSLPVAFQIAEFFSLPLNSLFERLSDQPHQQLISKTNYKESNMNYLVPFSPLREMREMLDGILDETSNWPTPVGITAPAVNISQTKKDVLLEMRLPGYKKEDLNIEVGEDFITVSGEASVESPDSDQKSAEERQYFRREFVSQSFSRSMSLPAPVISDQAKAEMKHGVLHITLPKQVEEKPKTTKLKIEE